MDSVDASKPADYATKAGSEGGLLYSGSRGQLKEDPSLPSNVEAIVLPEEISSEAGDALAEAEANKSSSSCVSGSAQGGVEPAAGCLSRPDAVQGYCSQLISDLVELVGSAREKQPHLERQTTESWTTGGSRRESKSLLDTAVGDIAADVLVPVSFPLSTKPSPAACQPSSLSSDVLFQAVQVRLLPTFRGETQGPLLGPIPYKNKL